MVTANADARYVSANYTGSVLISGTLTANILAGSHQGSGAGLTGTAASLTAGNATMAASATNIAGGGANQIPYNTGSGATSFLAAGTTGYILSAGPTPTWLQTLPVANGGSGATTLTGMLKGNGTSAFSAATAGTDYLIPGNALVTANADARYVSANYTGSVLISGTLTANILAGSHQGSGAGLTGTAASLTAGNATLAASATNIAGGGANQIPYNTGAGATSFLGSGTSGYVLQSNGAGSAPTWLQTLPVANGGSGATTLTGILKGNGTGAFTAATAGSDYVAPAGTLTGLIQNSSIAGNNYLNGGGNLGIGTASPGTALAVVGTVSANAFSFSDGSSMSTAPAGGAGGLLATANCKYYGGSVASGAAWWPFGASDIGHFYLVWANSAYGPSTQHLYITSATQGNLDSANWMWAVAIGVAGTGTPFTMTSVGFWPANMLLYGPITVTSASKWGQLVWGATNYSNQATAISSWKVAQLF